MCTAFVHQAYKEIFFLFADIVKIKEIPKNVV